MFDDIVNGKTPVNTPARNTQNPNTPPPTGLFDDIVSGNSAGQSNGNMFSDLVSSPTQEDQGGGFFSNLWKNTTKSLGGGVGAAEKVLLAPQRATTGLMTKGLESAGVLQPKTEGLGIKAGIKGEASNIDLLRRIGAETSLGQSTLGSSLTGQYTPTTSTFGNFVHELPVTALGTLADIFLDPTMVLGKMGKIEQGTTKLGEIISKGAKSVAEEIPAVQKIGDMLGKAFITRYGQSTEFQALDQARKVAESAVHENVSKLVTPVIEQPAAIQERITRVLTGVNPTDDEVKHLADPIRQELDRVGESISNLNPKLLSEDTFQAGKGTYFPRLYTDYEFPAGEELAQHVYGPSAINVPKEPFKARTLTDAESIAKGTRIEEAGFPALKRLTQLGVVEERQKFFKQVADIASDEAKPGWIQMSDDKGLGDLAGKFLPAPEYKAIADIRHVPSAVEKTYSKALTLWKTFKTAYNPATIARNDITNFFVLNPLGGVGPHRLDVYARTANELMSKGSLYELARQHGLEISTQQAAELTSKATRFYRENKSLTSQFFDKVGDFHNTVKDFYGSQDKFFKLANFIKGVTEDGLTPETAMQRANFYMVDYSEVPKVIDGLRKSPVGIPFISFTYGVSKPLAKTLLERPDKLGAYFKILQGIQSMNPQQESIAQRKQEMDVSPDWLQEGTYLRLPVKDQHGRGQYVDLQYILPFNVVETHGLLPGNPIYGILSSVFNNKDTFTGRDVTKKTDTTEEKVKKQATQITSMLLPSWTPFVGSSYTKMIDALKSRPDRNGFVKTKLETIVDVLGGVKITPIDATLEAQKRASERQADLLSLRSELRSILLNKSLFQNEKDKQSTEIRKKMSAITGSSIDDYAASLNE